MMKIRTEQTDKRSASVPLSTGKACSPPSRSFPPLFFQSPTSNFGYQYGGIHTFVPHTYIGTCELIPTRSMQTLKLIIGRIACDSSRSSKGLVHEQVQSTVGIIGRRVSRRYANAHVPVHVVAAACIVRVLDGQRDWLERRHAWRQLAFAVIHGHIHRIAAAKHVPTSPAKIYRVQPMVCDAQLENELGELEQEVCILPQSVWIDLKSTVGWKHLHVSAREGIVHTVGQLCHQRIS